MYRDLINISNNEINEASIKTTEAISNGEFYGKDQSDYYSGKMLNIEPKEVKLHYARDFIDKGDCKLGLHQVFLFIGDESKLYANDAENGVYFTCACLNCGRIDTYKMSQKDRRQTIYTQMKEFSAEDFYKVRARYLELQNSNVETEQIVEIINSECKENAKKNKQLIKK